MKIRKPLQSVERVGLPWNPCSSSSFQPAASQPASQPSPAARSDKSMNQRIDDSQLESNKVFYRGHMSPLTVFRRPPSQSVSQPASLVMFTIKTSTKEQIATRTLVATHPHYEYHGYWQPHQWYVSTAPRRSCPRLL